MNSPESRNRQSSPNIYLPAKLLGGAAIGLAVIGGVEKFTPMSEAAVPTWVTAGCAVVGAVAGATYGFFANRRQ